MTHFTRNPMKLRAHRLLDEVRAGIHHDAKAIDHALCMLGEPIERTYSRNRQAAPALRTGNGAIDVGPARQTLSLPRG